MRPQSKFLNAAPDREVEQNYTIEDGVVLDFDSKPNARKAYDEWTRYWTPSAADKAAEEAAWAARSGPCIVIKEGRKIAS